MYVKSEGMKKKLIEICRTLMNRIMKKRVNKTNKKEFIKSLGS